MEQKEFKLLSVREEEKLSESEKRKYYSELREYCKTRKLTNTTPGALTVAPKLKGMVERIAKSLCKILGGSDVKIVTDGLENIPEGPVIFASTHQGMLDNFCWLPDCPKHTLIFHGLETSKALLLAQWDIGLILVTKDKENISHRTNAKLDMISALIRGTSVWMAPETAWNLSPNKLHLPLNFGFIDIAKKANVPIVPLIIEYTYDTSSDKEKLTQIHIRYGEPITVAMDDSLIDKLEEYQEIISTIRWELIEEKRLFERKNISNWDYVNFVKGNLRNLKMGKISIDRERAGIQGANQEFYQFHHINDVPWDVWGNLLETEEVRRLRRINSKNLII